MKIDYKQPRPKGQTRPGVKPNPRRTPRPGTGRNKPAKGYNPDTKTWERN